MENKKEVQLQFRLKDVRLLQFVNLSNGWPEGDMQVGNQIQFNADTAQRVVLCNLNVEYKKNDLTQLLFGTQVVIEFSRESWSALYQLQGDQWVVPAELACHLADLTLGAARGMLSVKSEEAGLPRLILPLLNPHQVVRGNLLFPRQRSASEVPLPPSAGNA